jgi:hypothetical protein
MRLKMFFPNTFHRANRRPVHPRTAFAAVTAHLNIPASCFALIQSKKFTAEATNLAICYELQKMNTIASAKRYHEMAPSTII